MSAERRIALPIAVYPGLALTGAKVRDITTSSSAQYDAQVALHKRYKTPFVLTAMDLSAEAEAFGCQIHSSDNEVPSVTGRLVTNKAEAETLKVPKPGDKRTSVYLETVTRLCTLSDEPLVLAGCIGPFSLAARLAGVSEALELTATEPELMHLLVEKSSSFLAAYITAFRTAGASGVIMAEPAAGLLSPKALATFSSAYIRQIAREVQSDTFSIVLHNCAAKLVHLPAILETGLSTFHFGAPMDIPGALTRVGDRIVLCGNLDPAAMFCRLGPEQVASGAAELLAATAGFKNFVLSSGCDVPPNAPLANLDAFYAAVAAVKCLAS